MSESKIPSIISKLYILVDELESLFPERSFTLDGHLVGSIGEVAAKYFYNLQLLAVGNRNADAVTIEGRPRSVQIKLTAGKAVSLADYEDHPDILVVLRIDRRLGFSEIYNGPYPLSLLEGKIPSKRKVKVLSLSQLHAEQERVPKSLDDEGRIGTLNSYFRRDAS